MIMKTMNVSAYLFGGIALVNTIFFSSCTSEEQDLARAEYVTEIRVTREDFAYVEEGQTRTAYQFSSGKVGFQWATGDTLGIYPIGADQVSFPISSGDGSSSAAFDGGAWALRSTYQYAAYYPFTAKNYHIDQKSIPVSYLGQKQIGNSSMDNLAPYDYQAAAPTQPTATGGVNLAMKHLGAFLRLRLNIPEASTITSVTIRSDKAKFVTKGTFDLTSSSPAITATQTSSELTLELESVTTTSANQDIVVWMLVAPVDMSSSTLTISAITRTGKLFENTKVGMNLQAGTCYGFVVSLKNEGKYAFVHEYVDLGLPSGLKWATYNVGASSPEDFGDYYAWGETKPYYTSRALFYYDPPVNYKNGKTGYNWASYKWCSNGSLKELTKYTYDGGVTTESNNDPPFVGDNKTTLEPADDAAAVNWGESWRMPTVEELNELSRYCTWISTTSSGVSGYLVVSKTNGNSIFLPRAGCLSNGHFEFFDDCYWSSSLSEDYMDCAYMNKGIILPRCYGLTVRAVWQ